MLARPLSDGAGLWDGATREAANIPVMVMAYNGNVE